MEETGRDSSSLSNPKGSPVFSSSTLGFFGISWISGLKLGLFCPNLAINVVSPHFVLRVVRLLEKTSSNFELPFPPFLLYVFPNLDVILTPVSYSPRRLAGALASGRLRLSRSQWPTGGRGSPAREHTAGRHAGGGEGLHYSHKPRLRFR